MTQGRKPPEQASLDAEFETPASAESAEASSGLDAVPLIQESRDFPTESPPPTSTGAEEDSAVAETPAEDPPTPEPHLAESSSAAEAATGFDREAAEDVDAPAFDEAPADSDLLLGRFPGLWVKAGLADLAIHVAVVAVCGLAAWQLGLTPAAEQWPGYLGFAACFSFLYMSLPLAFWGQTPGMAASGLRAADGDRQLAFSQTTLRWLAAWLTLATIGLPWFLARSGRPLADRISRSETLVWEE